MSTCAERALATMAPTPQIWNARGFVECFYRINRTMRERRFAFVLGAGASVQSGIPHAGKLAKKWLTELHLCLGQPNQTLEEWATEANLGIPGFVLGDPARYYCQVYHKRFHEDPEEGYADLQHLMQGKLPSEGYAALSQIMAETQHQLVVTTNFDSLPQDALHIYTEAMPQVCGHESLAAFFRVRGRRPYIIKIHRDLLMNPMSMASEVANLHEAWTEPLRQAFSEYTPIVLGYGGNDGSLMGFLNSLEPRTIPGRMFWCYYAPDGLPCAEIQALVMRHNGIFVPIDGFDEIMNSLRDRLGYLPGNTLLERRFSALRDRASESHPRIGSDSTGLRETVPDTSTKANPVASDDQSKPHPEPCPPCSDEDGEDGEGKE